MPSRRPAGTAALT